MSRQLIDLSIYLENDVVSDPPIYRPKIDYIDHRMSVPELTSFFPGLQSSDLPDEEGWAIERISLITHLLPPGARPAGTATAVDTATAEVTAAGRTRPIHP